MVLHAICQSCSFEIVLRHLARVKVNIRAGLGLGHKFANCTRKISILGSVVSKLRRLSNSLQQCDWHQTLMSRLSQESLAVQREDEVESAFSSG